MKKKLKLNDWLEINSEEYESTIQRMIQLVSITKDIPPHIIEDWDIEALMKEYSSTRWLDAPINLDETISTLQLDGVELNLIDFNIIKFGQFIDLEWHIENGYIENIPKIIVTLYLQSVKEPFKKANVEKYGDIDIDERAEYIINKIHINDVYGTLQSYLKWRDNIFNSYSFWDSGLDDINVDELTAEELKIYKEEIAKLDKNKKTMWEDMLSMLSDGDITKYDEILDTNVFLVFNRISKIISDNKKSNR